jgi:hypothetical protein
LNASGITTLAVISVHCSFDPVGCCVISQTCIRDLLRFGWRISQAFCEQPDANLAQCDQFAGELIRMDTLRGSMKAQPLMIGKFLNGHSAKRGQCCRDANPST